MQVIADKFGAGSLTVDLTRSAVYFTVAHRATDICERKIIAFFTEFPLQSKKKNRPFWGCKSFFPRCESKKTMSLLAPLSVFRTYLIENKSHLTTEGLDTIRKIKSKMNKGKTISNDIDESLNTLKPGTPKQVLSLAAGRACGRWLIANAGENKIETNKHTRPPLFVGGGRFLGPSLEGPGLLGSYRAFAFGRCSR